MQENKKLTENTEINFFESIWFGFFPYWPLFAVLSILFFSIAFIYTRNKKPVYAVTASLMIDDNNNSTPNYSNQPFKALDVYAAKQSVDNEVLLLQSRSLMKKVVINLRLYAPLIEKGRISKASANEYSPILIEVQNPEKLERKENVYFYFDAARNEVFINRKAYPLNQWITFPYGTLRFNKNPEVTQPNNRNFFFSLYNPTTVADGLLGNLKVNTVNKLATVVLVTFQTEVPKEGAAIVNTLIKEYLNQSLSNSNQLAANTLSFVDERLKDVEQDLDSIERRIQQYRSAQGVVDLSEQGRLYLQNVAENDRRLAELNTQLAVLAQVEQYVNAQGNRPGVVPTALSINDPVLEQLLQRLNDLQLQLANLRTTTGENNPLVVSVESEIQQIRPNIRSIVANQRARLNVIRSNLAGTSTRFNTSIRNIPKQERELLEISRQQAVKRDLYSFLLQRREEAALSNASTIADNRIIDWAEASSAKVSSKKAIFFLGSVVAAFALGIIYILYREALSNKILFRSTIEKLTTSPVIGEIFFAKKSNHFLKTSDRSLLEQFHRLQAAIGLFSNQNQLKRVLITSNLPNEGKSFISSHFAASLALAGKRVALVDMNLQRPEDSNQLALKREKGLIEYLQGKSEVKEIIHQSEVKLMDIVPAGGSAVNSVKLLTPEKLHELFSYLDQHYEYIILDTPPVELATDAYILAVHCDVKLCIVRYGITPQKIIRKMDQNPTLSQVEDLLIVFNGVKGRGLVKKYFGFGYGYGKEEKYTNRAYSEAT
jgi:capsular exopolysaccharide synthesis family protein